MNIALLLAAGSGQRMGEKTPKQFLLIKGKPLFLYSLERLNNHRQIDMVVIVTNKEYVSEVKSIVRSLKKVKMVVAGGKTRQESVYNGLQAIKKIAKSDDIILIHDSARPLITPEVISNNIAVCQKHDAVDTVIKVNDTIIKSVSGQIVNDMPLRKELYQAQTPQTFKYSLILKAHEEALKHPLDDVTDDVKLVMAMGIEVYLVEGDRKMFKVTTKEDLSLMRALLKSE